MLRWRNDGNMFAVRVRGEEKTEEKAVTVCSWTVGRQDGWSAVGESRPGDEGGRASRVRSRGTVQAIVRHLDFTLSVMEAMGLVVSHRVIPSEFRLWYGWQIVGRKPHFFSW